MKRCINVTLLLNGLIYSKLATDISTKATKMIFVLHLNLKLIFQTKFLYCVFVSSFPLFELSHLNFSLNRQSRIAPPQNFISRINPLSKLPPTEADHIHNVPLR